MDYEIFLKASCGSSSTTYINIFRPWKRNHTGERIHLIKWIRTIGTA